MIGERLKDVRKDHGHHQSDLAALLNVSISAVQGWEQEKTSPSHEMLVQICRLYNVSADFLLGLTRTERREEFSREELAQIREFEEFLRWKKGRKRR